MARKTILIIDDAADHRDILGRLLRATGFHVVESDPGEAAFAAAADASPDLVMVGLSLPGQPAWETARLIHDELGETPILGTTVFGALLSRRRVRDIGCAECLDKPFDLDGILSAVRGLLYA